MGLGFSIIALAVLIALAIIGAVVPGLHVVFGVVIPYIALAVFVIGVIVRIIKWAKAPVPFRIPTTCGQEKSLSWIKPNKIDNPSTAFATFIRMAMEVLFFRSLFRNTSAEIRKGPKLAYGETKWLWLFGLMFHWSFLIIFLRHFRLFANPIPVFVDWLQFADGFFQIGLPIIYITDIAILIAVSYLFLRRVFDQKIKIMSLASDYFPLLLILGIAVSGVVMRYFVKTDIVAIKEAAVGILSFSPIVPADTIGVWFYIHFFLVCCLLIYFPMSKLVHMGGIFMSPTRNLANNNRIKHHKNPWKDDERLFPVKPHTYEEYEDEFRKVMKAADMPLEKDVEEKEDK